MEVPLRGAVGKEEAGLQVVWSRMCGVAVWWSTYFCVFGCREKAKCCLRVVQLKGGKQCKNRAVARHVSLLCGVPGCFVILAGKIKHVAFAWCQPRWDKQFWSHVVEVMAAVDRSVLETLVIPVAERQCVAA